jgi:hypothetical protein
VLSVAVALGAILLIPLTMLDQLMSAVLVAAPDLYGGLGDTNVGALWELVGIPAPSPGDSSPGDSSPALVALQRCPLAPCLPRVRGFRLL